MSSILTGIKLNEANPHNYDSDIDYYNALNRKTRGRSEDDYVEPHDDEPIKFQQDPKARPEYSISKDEDKDAGYNMTLTVKAPTTQKAEFAADRYVDSNWGAKKQVGKITPIADGVVQVHMIDNHKYGMWKPWKDEEPIQKPISFNESETKKGVMITETRTYKLWESAGQKIAEAQLTADQINQIFQHAEKIQTAGGANRTMLGKGKDAASAVNKAWEDLKTKVQDSGPIKGVDAMYDKAAEQLKQATGGDQGVMQYVQKYRDFAKKHPVAQSLIYSALIAAAGISGAGIGGAAALGLFKLVDKLLQGEKFSSAAYSGAKTGAMAYGASKVGDLIKGQPQGAPTTSGTTDTSGYTVTPTGQTGDFGQPTYNIKPLQDLANDPNLSPVAQKLAADLAAGKDVTGASNYLNKALNFAAQKAQMMGDMPDGSANAGMRQFMSLQNLMRAAEGHPALMKESVNLSESQIYLVIGKIVDRQRKLDEGIMDTVKGAAGKAVNWAKTKGTNLTTKVTADKLLQAWKKAGSPTDSLDVAKIVQDAGVPSDTIKQVYGNMKIPFAGEPGANSATRNIPVDPSSTAPSLPKAQDNATNAQTAGATSTPSASTSSAAPAATPAEEQKVQTTYAQVRALIDKLDTRGKQNVVKTLKKNLGIALTEDQINELSTDLLANYKKKASADATAADKKGDYKHGDKRMSGIVKATKKQFANDEKKVPEGKYDSGDYYNARQSREYGAKSSQVDSGAYEFEKEVHRNEPGGEHGRPKNLKGVSKSLPADAFGRTTGKIPAGKPGRIHSMMNDVDENLDENLHKWFQEKWVRFGPDGKIRGDCARGDDSEGKPKCLPQSKAQNLGKKGRASAAARKRREDPNPERSGKAINVNTKKKTNEAELDEACWKGYHKEGNKKMFGKTYPNCVKNTNEELDIEEGRENYNGLNILLQKDDEELFVKASAGGRELGHVLFVIDNGYLMPQDLEVEERFRGQGIAQTMYDYVKSKGYKIRRSGQQTDAGAGFWDKHRPEQNVWEEHHSETCPQCGGEMVSEELMNEKKDACYYKVKSRYKVWPSAYASGALVKCRKSGADSWGNGGKKNESVAEGEVKQFPKKHRGDLEDTHSCVKCGGDLQGGTYMGHKVKVCMPCKQVYLPPNTGIDQRGNKVDEQGVAEDQLDEKWTKKYKDSINCNNPKGFSQKAHCAGKQKNESAIMKGLKL